MHYNSIITTLFENHYEYGVGAFINSLVSAEFEGLICIGYKGKLPFWLTQLTKTEDGLFQVSEKIYLRFDLLNIEMHFGYYKPYYLKQMADAYPNATSLFYFDPDIFVIGHWSFFENWIKYGVALCQDANYPLLHWNHPWRNQWRKDFAGTDLEIDKSLNYYINSGFIGINKHCIEILDSWIATNEQYKTLGYPITYFDQSKALSPYKGDQDVLNATITVNSNITLSILGKEAMGFEYPIALMVHALDGKGIKPWKRKYLRYALTGNRPSIADELYLNYCKAPLVLYSNKELKSKRMELKIAKIINRIWKK